MVCQVSRNALFCAHYGRVDYSDRDNPLEGAKAGKAGSLPSRGPARKLRNHQVDPRTPAMTLEYFFILSTFIKIVLKNQYTI